MGSGGSFCKRQKLLVQAVSHQLYLKQLWHFWPVLITCDGVHSGNLLIQYAYVPKKPKFIMSTYYLYISRMKFVTVCCINIQSRSKQPGIAPTLFCRHLLLQNCALRLVVLDCSICSSSSSGSSITAATVVLVVLVTVLVRSGHSISSINGICKSSWMSYQCAYTCRQLSKSSF